MKDTRTRTRLGDRRSASATARTSGKPQCHDSLLSSLLCPWPHTFHGTLCILSSSAGCLFEAPALQRFTTRRIHHTLLNWQACIHALCRRVIERLLEIPTCVSSKTLHAWARFFLSCSGYPHDQDICGLRSASYSPAPGFPL